MPYSKGERTKLKNQQFREQQKQQYEDEKVDDNTEQNVTNDIECCVPTVCLMNGEPVNIHDPDEVAKVVCNNPGCDIGNYMHKCCFAAWEDEVLTYLRSSGRARSWSEKQRRQNLWTKKGFDLAWKACSCKCSKGHLRKDLDWIPPKIPDGQRKVRRKKKSGDRPTIGMLGSSVKKSQPLVGGLGARFQRQGSTSSTENYSPPSSGDTMRRKTSNVTFEFPPPIGNFNNELRNGYHLGSQSNIRGRSSSSSPTDENVSGIRSFTSPGSTNAKHIGILNNNSKHSPGVHFLRRLDFTSFQSALPKHKFNAYHIRMEEDVNDDIRAFILSTLSTYETTYIICTLCGQQLPVFDKYPLIDGTFFLTPQRHTDGCLQVFFDNKPLHLSAVCVNCLEGAQIIICRGCKTRWDGSHHQLGTMYKYDIFAARPCCSSRLACKHCGQPVIDIRQATNYYSDYSQNIQCPHCSVSDFHFVKPLSSYELIQHP
ncbi:headcase protein homolog [Saccoglossus kowalevskii]|uniref:Headcase protein-like n=1 Tax=Saccoglossus kowalevskii TaxID=10224 RepID=A0ABM0GN66_SACKO|nr:PREDICTED: headcase protein-like [Saccoglossus kowalevskii]